MLDLMPHQRKAVEELRNGNILYGPVGSGKGRAAVAYYEKYEAPKDVYVITTAKKRDDLDWVKDFLLIHVTGDVELEGSTLNFGHTSKYGKLTVDSWNNIGKYADIKDAFFIFDEQRLVGNGAWVKAYIKIARNNNHWIMLSGTPGDTWMDYAPVFIANGFFKNITEFKREHVLYEPFAKFPKIKGYLKEWKLELMRNHILVEMPFARHTIRTPNQWDVTYDKDLMDKVVKRRWHVFEERPIKDVAELWRVMRKVVNTDQSRLDALWKLQSMHPRLIVFYNFDYELEMLKAEFRFHRPDVDYTLAEYNGHKKDPIPTSQQWIYLVQYTAGAEGWNCIETDATVFYSLPYSYKIFEQAHGRIDRLNTPFTNLYYYYLMSNSLVDRGIWGSLGVKEDFQVRKYVDHVFSTDAELLSVIKGFRDGS